MSVIAIIKGMKLVTFGRTVVFVALSAFAFEALAEVSGDSAVVSLIQNGKETLYRSLEALLADCTNEATIVVHEDCELSRRVTVTKSLTVVGVGSGRTVSAPGLTDFGFWVDSGTLTFSNITFSAYTGKGLVVVDGADATFVLAKGARLDGLRGVETDDYYSDAITVQAGTATLLPGCEISGCSCYAGNWGGAVLVKEGGRLNLWGGTVTNCFATFGGGVNVEEGGVVSVKGDVRVSGNRAKPRNVEIASDIYVNYDSNPETAIKLDGAVTSADRSIGIHCCNSSANAEGASFASAGESFPESEATSTAAKFFCDATAGEDPSLIGAYAQGGRTLKWAMTEKPIVPDDAVIRVITGGGAVTNSYGSVSQAFANLTADAVVEVLTDCSFQEDLTVGTAIVLRSVKGMFREMTRNGDYSVVVKTGGRLAISDLSVNGGGFPCEKALIRVEGGALSLENGGEVKNATCKTGDCGGAGILVDRGALTMSADAVISGCSCTGEMSEGAGIWATGTDIDLEGGTISGCKADRSAAVCLHDCRSLKIGGITLDAIQSGNGVKASYTCYGDGCSEVELTGRLQIEGEGGFQIDISRGGDCFGFVNADCLKETEVEILAYAAGVFFRTEEKSVSSGCVVTNANEALLVWASAVRDGLYEDKDGNRYFVVNGDVPPVPPKPVVVDPDPIGFASVAREADGTWTLVVTNRRAWANYRLIWTDDLARGFTTTGAWEQATSDGTWTTNVTTSGNAVFWRAEGKRGEVPREL